MAFVWVQDISPGAPANAAGLNEIQDNLDNIYTALGITRTGCASGAGWTEFPLAGGLVDPKLSSNPSNCGMPLITPMTTSARHTTVATKTVWISMNTRTTKVAICPATIPLIILATAMICMVLTTVAICRG